MFKTGSLLLHYKVNVRLTLFIPFQIVNSTNGLKNNGTGKLWWQLGIIAVWQKYNWIHCPNENYQIKWKTTSLPVDRRDSLVRDFNMVKNENLRSKKEMISICPLWTFYLYVATLQQHLYTEYTSHHIQKLRVLSS